jgi:hypothetical protein
MSEINLSEFTDRHEGGKGGKPLKVKKGWEWTPICPRFVGSILAFDQTLSNTGFVILEARLVIRHVGMISPADTGEKGHLDNLLKAQAIFAKAMEIVAMAKQHAPNLRIVHETPPITGKGARMSRPESSLLAAHSIRLAAHLQGVHDIHMIGAQAVKSRFTGDRNADKKVMHDVLYREFPEIRERKPNNDNTRDALGLAVLAAEKE